MPCSFFIDSSYRNEIREWAATNLPYDFEKNRYRHRWFPFYTTNGISSIRLDILEDEDVTMFLLARPFEILKTVPA